MNRRSFLKFLPAGVIGAKQAAAEAAEKLALPGADTLLGGNGPSPPVGFVSPSGDDYGTASWSRKGLMRLVDPKYLANLRRDTGVTALDPDLASMRSMSLSVRIEMQRERNMQRSIDRERSYLNGFLEKVFD